MVDALWATGLAVVGLGFGLVLLGWHGWQLVSRETNRRSPSAG